MSYRLTPIPAQDVQVGDLLADQNANRKYVTKVLRQPKSRSVHIFYNDKSETLAAFETQLTLATWYDNEGGTGA